MTWRAVLIGLLLGLPLAAFGWLNDWILLQAYVANDLVPTSVYGLLLAGLLLANPLLRLMGKCQLRGSEWSVIVALMLTACVIPGPSLLATFNNTLVMPLQFNHNNPSWREHNLMDYVPPGLLVEPGDQYDKVVKGFATGLKQGNKLIDWTDVPWGAWARPMSFWLPVLALSFVGGICLVLLVHRQWSQRERLRYPIAEFAGELLGGAGEGFWSRIFHNRRFWIGFGISFGILTINGLYTWGKPFTWGHHLIQIPLELPDVQQVLIAKWPFLESYSGNWGITIPRFYFVVIGIAYFVSGEVSFSLGISMFAYLLFFYIVFELGINAGGDYLGGNFFAYQKFGAYLGMGLIVLYIGRRFYTMVLLNAFAIPTAQRASRTEVWACRLALLAGAALVAALTAIGLDWRLAVVFVLLAGLLFLMVTRVNVETGVIAVQPGWHAVGVLMGTFGVAALGPRMLVILAMLSAVITIDPKCCLMPMVANSLKFSELQGVRPQRLSPVLAVGVLLALVVGVTATLYFQYNYGGAPPTIGWLSEPAQAAFNVLNQNMPTFEADTLHRTSFPFAPIAANGKAFLTPAGLGLAMVLICSLLRLRYQWWPIHPVLFLVWGTFPMVVFAWSFLLGWAIKASVTTFGGGESYRRNKPLFVGLVAGEFAAAIVWAVIGVIYYFNNNYVPGPSVRFHP